MRPVSSRYISAIANPVRRLAEVTVTLPGDSTATTLDIEADQCTVTMADHPRYSASISLSPNLRSDVYALAATPGALFRIRSGVSYGSGDVEWVDCGVFEAVAASRSLAVGDTPLTLVDRTNTLEECRFTAPWATSQATRAAEIASMVTDAISGQTVSTLGDGGAFSQVVYERDRLTAINELASGGNLDAAFDAVGTFVIQPLPILTVNAPDWIARTGEAGTILEGAGREVPLARLYNTLVLGASEDFQTWGAITARIADTNHPRHYTKIGVRPFFRTDPTITTQAQATATAEALLQQLLTATEEIKLPSLGNPALEYGDTIAVAHSATETDPGLAAAYLVEGWSFNLGTGAQDITARSSDKPALEEV